MVAGGAVAKVAGNATATTPAWRGAVSDMSITVNFNESDNTAGYINAQKFAYAQMEPFRQLAPVPHGGQYLNEVCSEYIVGQAHILREFYRPISWNRTGNKLSGDPIIPGF
jgi:hypothetical protein